METTVSSESSIARPDSGILSALRVAVLAALGGLVLRLLMATWRWELHGLLRESRIWTNPGPRIFVFWHGRQLMMPGLFRQLGGREQGARVFTLISRHSDGRIIARIARSLGLDSIAGSSHRGSVEAGRRLVETLKAGNDIAITPDGPRGPAEKLKLGVIKISQLSGATIYPVAAAASRQWRFGSWDHMVLPLPFSKIRATCEQGILLPANLSESEIREAVARVEGSLQKATERVDN